MEAKEPKPMGTPSDPTEPDYEDGASCVACEDEIFDGHTPLYVKAIFDGIIACPPFPPPTFEMSAILKQVGASPCSWTVDKLVGGSQYALNWVINFGAGPNNSRLDFEIDAAFVFRGRSAETCGANFSNNLDCGDGWTVHEGTGAVRWGPEIDEAAYDAQFP